MVQQRLPRVSLGTVYRNLEMLSQTGIIGKIESPGAPMRFDWNVAPHHHVRCQRCGRVGDLHLHLPETVPGMDAFLGVRDPKSGFVLTGYQVELVGLCRSCYDQMQVSPKDMD